MTLALRFLAFLLFIFMNSHGICASRDLKVELQDQKGVDDSFAATPISTDNDEPIYLTGYTTTPKSIQPNYRASYTTFKKQNHPSQHEKINEPYITGYITTPKSTQHDEKLNQPYIAGYISTPKSTQHDEKLNQPYITGYITTPKYSQHDEKLNQPYITGYITTPKSTQRDEKLNQPYITGYITTPKSTQRDEKLNQPHITGYITTPKSSQHGEKLNQPYITGYITSNHDSKQDPKAIVHDSTKPYVTNYGLHPRKVYSKESVDSNEPYITQYGNTGPKNDAKESAHDHDKAYVTQYGNHDTTKDIKAKAHDSNTPYVRNYGIHPKKDSGETATQDCNYEPYITQYGTGIKNYPTESSQDHDKPYITQYGNHDSKQDYAALYKRKQEESKGASSNVDHTEAFKTGFFSLDDLYVGNIMTLQFPVQEFSHFLPKKDADTIPFSTSQLSSVLQLFLISEDSPMAKSIRGTLEQCEAETITGETKICANSLESMLEFVNTIIGSDTKYDILTTSHPTPSAAPLQKYTILEVSKDIYAPKWVACHPLPYPYAVYYCHFIATGSKVFKVLLSGEIGDQMEALGICHLDTSDWSPDHILFKQLGFMPGEAPVCHFFPVKHLMWVPQPLAATM